jgi:putative hydrolase of the HAD superfamily
MLFFDLDGTLLDFKSAEYAGVLTFHAEFRSSYGLCDHPGDFYESWCRIGIKHYSRFLRGELSFGGQQAARIREVLQAELPDREALDLFGWYLRQFEANWKPYDDVLPCLRRLEGRRLGVITNGDPVQQADKLRRMGIAPFFDIVVASGEAGVAKPDPAIFRIACERTGTTPCELIYVGDDPVADIAPCVPLQATGIWINRRNQAPAVPVQRTIASLDELFDHLP